MDTFVSYLTSSQDVLDHFGTTEAGLSSPERDKRLEQYGYNRLERFNATSARVKFFGQFKDLMIILLIVTALLSLYLQDRRTAIILIIIVLVNAVIGYLQEAKAERLLASLQKMVHPDAKVKIAGELHELKSEQLVPGDIVYVEAGDAVPADLRIIQEHNLQTNDFSLTGESNPQKKHTHAIGKEVGLGDRTNIAFMGTTVALGQGWGVVIATGMDTELGRIAQLSGEVTHERSPLQKEFDHVATRLTWGTVILGTILFVVALGMELTMHEALLFAIGIAASMVPQGLPAQISIALSSAAGRLAKKRALVKKLSSVETLGAVNVICTDKTGTLTKNEMTVQRVLIGDQVDEVTGVGYQPDGDLVSKSIDDKWSQLFFTIGVAASNASISPPDDEHATWYSIGDPTEAALVTLAAKAGIEQDTLNNQLPELLEFSFDSVRKRMSSVRQLPDGSCRVYCKGAAQSVLEVATHYFDGESVRPITQKDKVFLEQIDKQRAGDAMRNLMFAYKDLDSCDPDMAMEEVESELVVLGMVAMIDPPRSTVPAAIDACHNAHIKVVIITGDYAMTAEAIGSRIHLQSPTSQVTVIEGKQLPTMSDEKLIDTLQSTDSLIFARMSPEDKIRVVDLCKQAGRLVAVTGDGVNDSPALKKADIGVAMGKTGTDVAKDAAEIILLDDSFATLVDAIKEGRVIFQNLKTTVTASMTSNGGELAAVLLGIIGNTLFGWPLAISAIQILAIDLLGEMLPLAALTWDPPKKDIMEQPARDPDRHILQRSKIVDLIRSGVLMGGLAFLAYGAHYWFRGMAVTDFSAGSAFHMAGMSVTYVTIVLCQFMNILSRRAGENTSVFTRYLWSNKTLLRAFAISLFLIANLIYNPRINVYFGTGPLDLLDRGIVGAAAIGFLLIRELAKSINKTKKSGPAGQHA